MKPEMVSAEEAAELLKGAGDSSQYDVVRMSSPVVIREVI